MVTCRVSSDHTLVEDDPAVVVHPGCFAEGVRNREKAAAGHGESLVGHDQRLECFAWSNFGDIKLFIRLDRRLRIASRGYSEIHVCKSMGINVIFLWVAIVVQIRLRYRLGAACRVPGANTYSYCYIVVVIKLFITFLMAEI